MTDMLSVSLVFGAGLLVGAFLVRILWPRVERRAHAVHFIAGGPAYAIGPETGYTKEEAEQIVALLRRVISGKQAGLIVPAGWELYIPLRPM